MRRKEEDYTVKMRMRDILKLERECRILMIMISVDLTDESSVPDPDRPLVAAFDKVEVGTDIAPLSFPLPNLPHPLLPLVTIFFACQANSLVDQHILSSRRGCVLSSF